MSSSDELVEVFSTDNPNEAELLCLALRGEGFKCEIDGRSQAGFTGIGVMEVKLLVRAGDFDAARSYLEKHEHNP